MDELVKIWTNDLELVDVDGYKIKILKTDVDEYNFHKLKDEVVITFKLGELSKEDLHIYDYGDKLYSRWGFKSINLFIHKLKGDEDYTPSPNWTEIKFKNDYANYIYYNRYMFRVSLFKPTIILREEKLKKLGL